MTRIKFLRTASSNFARWKRMRDELGDDYIAKGGLSSKDRKLNWGGSGFIRMLNENDAFLGELDDLDEEGILRKISIEGTIGGERKG